MRTRYFVGGLLAAALLSSTAIAQNTTPAASPNATVTTTAPSGSEWRASKLIGVNIYNEQNEKLGDISEIILSKEGRVAGYVIGVGGFLGMGQHDILVEPGKIKFVDEPMRTTTSANTPPAGRTPPAGTMTTRPASGTTASTTKQWYPDHGVLSATKDQLKAMAQFKY
jgi:sporulation protein YlmC with PRC-barrel domain